MREFLGIHPALVVGVLAMLAVPRVANPYWTFQVTAGFMVAMSCLGLLVLAGWARQISLAQAGLTGSAVYLCRYAYGDPDHASGRGWPFPVALAWTVGFVIAVSFLIGLVSMRLAGPYAIVLTLSIQFWLENSLLGHTPPAAGLSAPSTPRPNFFTLSLRSDSRFYYFLLCFLLIVVIFLHRARHSRFGRSMILVGSDPEAAACVGISPWRYRVWAFTVAGALAGLAGALSAPLYVSPPGVLQYMTFNSLFYLAVPVLAGFDSVIGTVAVAVVFSLMPHIVLSWGLNVYLLGGAGMAAGVLLGPRGLSGVIADRFGGRHAT